MRNQCGIWLDHREAIIVKLKDDSYTVDRIESEVESRHRSTGGTRGQRPFNHRSVNSAARSDRRRHNEWQHHYQHILSRMPKSGSVLLLGPGPAKTEFLGYLNELGVNGIKIVGVEGTRRLTLGQLVARIKTTFGVETRASWVSMRMSLT